MMLSSAWRTTPTGRAPTARFSPGRPSPRTARNTNPWSIHHHRWTGRRTYRFPRRRRRFVRAAVPLSRVPPHRPHGRAAVGQHDLAADLEAEPLVVRDVVGFRRLQVRRGVFGVDAVQARPHQRLSVSFATHGGVAADYPSIPVRLFGVLALQQFLY